MLSACSEVLQHQQPHIACLECGVFNYMPHVLRFTFHFTDSTNTLVYQQVWIPQD